VQRAQGQGYARSELNALRRMAELCQAATGCSIDAAIGVSLAPAHTVQRLFSYGGRFIASPGNFKAGLKLISDFPDWFGAINKQIEPRRLPRGHLPAGANFAATAINANTLSFEPNAARAFEKFLFEEIAVNGAIPLASDDPERIFGMEANPAMRFVGRGYLRDSADTLAQIPLEPRRVLYAVIDALSPLGATESTPPTTAAGHMG
jgi:hypothetical protein